MYFKDWDSQRAAKNEVSKDGREEVKKKATREEKVLFPAIRRSNCGKLKERESRRGPGFRKTHPFSDFSRKTAASERRRPPRAHLRAGVGPERL